MKIKRKADKIMEYEDAPSGSVKLYNYKEPFMKFEKGFGFEGVLLFDAEDDTVQCHLCGNWYEFLGPHIFREHHIFASEYKQEVGLLQTTALIGEKMREKLIAYRLGKKAKIRNLRAGGKKTQAQKDKIRETLKKNSELRESQNRMETCPLQLIERLQKLATELGRTPLSREVGFEETLVKVYGTYNEACRIAGLTPRKVGETLRKIKPGTYTKEILLEFIVNFKKIHGRNPSRSDRERNLLPSTESYRRHFGSWKVALEEAEKMVQSEGEKTQEDSARGTKKEAVESL